MTFNQYRQLKLPDIVKSETLINLLADNKTFDELKKNIQKLGVLNPKKNDFLEFFNRISENLESIEIIRNCVAHNREPDEKELENYNVAKQKLDNHITEFFNSLSSLCPDCGGKIETLQNFGIKNTDKQPEMIRYKVQCKDCGKVFNEEIIDL